MDGIPDVAEQGRANLDRPNEQGRGERVLSYCVGPVVLPNSTFHRLAGRPSEVQWSVATPDHTLHKSRQVNVWRKV